MVRIKSDIYTKHQDLAYIWIFILLILILIVVQCDIGIRAQQTIISEDTYWTFENSPYIITRNVLIEHGATLTIEPGVELKFDDFYYMQIEGKLIAEGTENNMITFTSNKDSPAPRDWRSIKFMKNADYGSSFKYCKIEYAYTAIVLDEIIFYAAPNITNSIIRDISWGGIEYYTCGDYTINSSKQIANNTIINSVDGHAIDIHFYVNSVNANLLVSNNTLRFNEGNAIVSSSYEGNMTLTNNILMNNEGPGIVCHGDNVNIKYNFIASNNGPGIALAGAEGDSYLIEHNTIINNCDPNDKDGGGINFEQHEDTTNIVFRYNNIYNNTPYDTYNGRENDINLPNNWWGTTDTEIIDQQINDYYDDFNKGKLNYTPFLTETDSDAPDPSAYMDESSDTPTTPDDTDGNNDIIVPIFLVTIVIIIVVIGIVILISKRK
jgi:hypothetical protein